jgi:SpoVK/Ycf46/Vps4 family AAA+-type ATPase
VLPADILKWNRDLNKIRPQNNIHAFSCLVFIFLADALVGSRGHREQGVQERVLSALLTEMDGIGVQQDSLSAMYKTYRDNKSVCPAQVIRCK